MLLQRALDQPQGLAHRLRQLLRERRRTHAARRAHEQRIVEQRSQARQRVAHRRLRQPDALAGNGDAAFGRNRVERAQQIQVDVRYIHI